MSDYFNDAFFFFSANSEKVLVPKTVYFIWLETIRKTCDNHGVFAAIITDLFKTFDCISHEILIAKQNALALMKFH